jgi:cytochrome c556
MNALFRRRACRAVLLALVASSVSQAADPRQQVEMPAPMQEHMLANMREHLVALGEIQAALAAGKFSQAADIAENRVGMSSLQTHGASHMAPYMPKPMQDIGTAMHQSASRFARIAQEAAVANDLPRALSALADLTRQCTACHASYRLQ